MAYFRPSNKCKKLNKETLENETESLDFLTTHKCCLDFIGHTLLESPAKHNSI